MEEFSSGIFWLNIWIGRGSGNIKDRAKTLKLISQLTLLLNAMMTQFTFGPFSPFGSNLSIEYQSIYWVSIDLLNIYPSPSVITAPLSLKPSAAEKLLPPLPSPLQNQPQALKGDAPPLSKLRMNIVFERSSLAPLVFLLLNCHCLWTTGEK